MPNLTTRIVYCAITALTIIIPLQTSAAPNAGFRPPAVPLVAHDPYFSVWSFADKLTDGWPRHWTGTNHAMCGIARIDGKAYRFMGPDPRDTPTMKQIAVTVTPTRTRYEFEADGAHLVLSFITPALCTNLDLLSRPLTYVQFEVSATDQKSHDVSLYFDCSAEIAVNRPEQLVNWTRAWVNGMQVMRVGTVDQPVLEKRGDDLRIDWGYLYLAVPEQKSPVPDTAMAGSRELRAAFTKDGKITSEDDLRMPRQVNDEWPVLACRMSFPDLAETTKSTHLMLAYDDLYSIEYFQRKLRPYWRRNGMEIGDLLKSAENEFLQIEQQCRQFDEQLTVDLVAAGGEKYAQLAILAYRQCLAAYKLAADFDGTPLYFSKENFSNGCIGTVDVIYPAAPQHLLLNPELVRAQLTPVLDYASTNRWKFPFAPHDLGTYPKANGQVYGGGERTEDDQMPVEESGNMLILLAALAKAEGNADYTLKYWPVCTKWANYLREKGLDPENQLCTDDFAGHLAHNTNLSLKAIIGLASFAELAKMGGKEQEAAEYRKLAEQFAKEWVSRAADGDHYRLTFDGPGTWSQKYNLVWDRVLGLKLFPPELAQKEIAFYRTKLQKYGLPLDSRKTYTKTDWTVWTATLAEYPADFAVLTDPIYAFLNESPSRVPLTDWYETTDAKMVGFQARSVVGGVFMPMLARPELWSKWVKLAKPPAK